MVGLAEETSDASLACRQVGPIRVVGEPKEGERVFSESRSLIFKSLQVVRFFDKKRQTYIYLAYSDRVIDGSPQNSISTVPIQSWPGRSRAGGISLHMLHGRVRGGVVNWPGFRETT